MAAWTSTCLSQDHRRGDLWEFAKRPASPRIDSMTLATASFWMLGALITVIALMIRAAASDGIDTLLRVVTWPLFFPSALTALLLACFATLYRIESIAPADHPYRFELGTAWFWFAVYGAISVVALSQVALGRRRRLDVPGKHLQRRIAMAKQRVGRRLVDERPGWSSTGKANATLTA